MATSLALIVVTLAAALSLLLPPEPSTPASRRAEREARRRRSGAAGRVRFPWPDRLRGPRARAVAMAVALVGAPLILAGEVWDTSAVTHLRDRSTGPIIIAVLAVGGIAVLIAGAAFLRRRPGWLPLIVAAVLPFRIPIEVGDGQPVNLLVPLYLVTGAAALGWAWDRWRGAHAPPAAAARDDEPGAGDPAPSTRELVPRTDVRATPADAALLLFVVLYAIESLWTGDRSKAVEQVAFFYVPFSLLYVVLRTTPWSTRIAARSLGVASAVALVLGAIGLYEYATKTVLLNPKVIASNQIEDVFRVNSLFFDPNIYGRFLALVMLGLVGWLLWATSARTVRILTVVVVLLLGSLVLTYSQTSFVALLVGLGVLAALRFGARVVVLPGVAIVAVGLVIVLAAPSLVHLDGSADQQTSGRASLVDGGLGVFADHPIAGVGSGDFSRAYRERNRSAGVQETVDASHTIPITVAAEQGIIGLAAYLALLVIVLRGLLRRAGEDVARAAVAAMVVALVVHTLGYAAFLEDPVLWVLLAVGAGLPPLPPKRRARPAGLAPAAET